MAIKRKKELNDLEKVRRKRKRKKSARNLVLLLVAAAVVLVFFNFREKLTAEYIGASYSDFTSRFTRGDGYPVSLGLGVPRSIDTSTGGALDVLTASEVITYNKNGAAVKNVPHSIDQPYMKNAGGNTVVFGRGNKDYRLYSKTGEIYGKSMDYSIIDADVDANGNVAVATDSERYFGELNVYDRNQQLKYSWYSSKEYIQSVDFGKSGNIVVTCISSPTDGAFTTVIYVLNTGQEKEISRTEFPGEIALRVHWNGNNIIAVFEERAIAIKRDGGVIAGAAFDSTVLSVQKLDGDRIAIALGDNAQSLSNRILIVDSKCAVKGQFGYPHTILGVYANGGKVAVLSEKTLNIYNHAGELERTEDIGKICVALTGQGNTLYVQTSDTIERISL